MDVEQPTTNYPVRRKVGTVKVSESNTLYAIFKHLNSLEELEMIISNKDVAYERFQNDLEHTRQIFHQWWDETSTLYNWEHSDKGNWEINFETCEIFLSEC